MAKWRGTYRTAQCGHIAWPVHCFRQWDEPSGDGRSAKLGCAPRLSELDEEPLAFDAVELLGFPVDAFLGHLAGLSLFAGFPHITSTACVVLVHTI